ncbi:hypothetical protein [Hyalangium versicolor]|uniref:hypothetical protein n=1 Tax=Hyalangium versicolor TaxID=2861190 RepID=UPI001CCC10DA|nr:hypothetical protein [Hyalangium versicolor]
MSTDTFYVKVGKIKNRSVTLHCLTGFAGGMKDHAWSRSFALMLLVDAKGRVGDAPYWAKGLPRELAKKRLALAKKVDDAPFSLDDDLPGLGYEEAWHAENTPRFVSRSRLLKRYNNVKDGLLWKARRELSPLEKKGSGAFLEGAWKRMHRFDLLVEVTDAKYLDHLVEGHFFGTTAFDAWIEKELPPPKKEKAAPAKAKKAAPAPARKRAAPAKAKKAAPAPARKRTAARR